MCAAQTDKNSGSLILLLYSEQHRPELKLETSNYRTCMGTLTRLQQACAYIQHVYMHDNMLRRGHHLTKVHRIIHLPEMMQLVATTSQSLKAACTAFILNSPSHAG